MGARFIGWKRHVVARTEGTGFTGKPDRALLVEYVNGLFVRGVIVIRPRLGAGREYIETTSELFTVCGFVELFPPERCLALLQLRPIEVILVTCTMHGARGFVEIMLTPVQPDTKRRWCELFFVGFCGTFVIVPLNHLCQEATATLLANVVNQTFQESCE